MLNVPTGMLDTKVAWSIQYMSVYVSISMC